MNPTVRPDLTASEFATQVCITGMLSVNLIRQWLNQILRRCRSQLVE